MFKSIMTPIDLSHPKAMAKALKVSAILAQAEEGTVTYVSVTGNLPGSVAHSPEEFKSKLSDFAREQAEAHGIKTDSYTIVSHDPTVDLDDKLLAASKDLGADTVVMASHTPGMLSTFLPSHGGKLASHSKASVFVVRDEA